jgi:hypothetical protein
LSSQFAASASGRFQFEKRSQLFIRTHNETLSVVAMRVCNPDYSPSGIHACDTAPTPSGLRGDYEMIKNGRDDAGCHALLLSRQTLSAARFLFRMRTAASSARRFNSASPGVNRKNSKSRLLISSSPVLFAPSFL